MEKANLSDPEHKTKTGVSTVKVNFLIFLLLIFRLLENRTALILRGVTSQDRNPCKYNEIPQQINNGILINFNDSSVNNNKQLTFATPSLKLWSISGKASVSITSNQ